MVNAYEIVIFVSDFLQETDKQGRVISRKRKVVLTEDRCGVVQGSDRPPLRHTQTETNNPRVQYPPLKQLTTDTIYFSSIELPQHPPELSAPRN